MIKLFYKDSNVQRAYILNYQSQMHNLAKKYEYKNNFQLFRISVVNVYSIKSKNVK